MADSDLTTALRAIRSELEVSGATYADESRLLAAVERISALADQWHGERGNDYSASALHASKLREALREELLSKEDSDGD
jgi:hypothetical protein